HRQAPRQEHLAFAARRTLTAVEGAPFLPAGLHCSPSGGCAHVTGAGRTGAAAFAKRICTLPRRRPLPHADASFAPFMEPGSPFGAGRQDPYGTRPWLQGLSMASSAGGASMGCSHSQGDRPVHGRHVLSVTAIQPQTRLATNF